MLNDIIKKVLREATSDSSGSRGSFVVPLRPGLRKFDKTQLGPFTEKVSKYDSPLLDYDSYDGKMSETKKQIKKIEGKSEKSAKFLKNHPIQNDDDGDIINPTPGKNKKIVPIKEDLAVWFGTKKKPKGSKQPKGPWVDICRKVNGKHPPCGRSDSDSGAYPKCRAVGVAGKMSDSAKKAACQQKRKAEKKDTQTGKGQKPIMTSYKPRKKTNENMKTIRLTESDLVRIVKRIIKESEQLPTGRLDLICVNYVSGEKGNFYDMVGVGQLSDTPNGKGFSIKKNPSSMIPSDNPAGGSDDRQNLTIEQPTDTLKEYLKKRFPNIDFDKTQLKNMLYLKGLLGGQGFCRTSESTDQEWLDFFDRNNVTYKIV
jgi:hypothetical protein